MCRTAAGHDMIVVELWKGRTRPGPAIEVTSQWRTVPVSSLNAERISDRSGLHTAWQTVAIGNRLRNGIASRPRFSGWTTLCRNLQGSMALRSRRTTKVGQTVRSHGAGAFVASYRSSWLTRTD